MNKGLLIAMVLIILIGACSSNATKENNQQNYTITGTLNGVEDGMLIVLGNQENNTPIDTCIIKEGKFYFEGEAEYPRYAIIRVYKEGEPRVLGYTTFYLDNSDYLLDTDFENMKKAYLTGSVENDIVNAFKKSTEKYSIKEDSIRNIFQGSREGKPLSEEERSELLALGSKLRMEERELNKQFVIEHTDIYPSMYMLGKFTVSYANYIKAVENPTGYTPKEPLFSKEELIATYNSMSDKYKNTDIAKAIYTTLFEEKAVVGEPYIEFVDTYTMDGKPFKISDVTTDYVLLDFTGVYCKWCKVFNKNMMPHYDKVKDKLTIVAFYTDTDQELIRKSAENAGYPWLIVSDLKGENSVNKKHYQIQGIPDFFLLDKKRNIVKHIVGYSEEFIEELVALGGE